MTTIHDAEEPTEVSKASASSYYRIAGTIWCILTVLICVSLALVYLAPGVEVVSKLLQEGPSSNLHVTLASVAVAWTLLGVLIAMLYLRKITPANVVTVAGFFLIALLYLNVVRERYDFGDIRDYIRGAKNLHAGQPVDPFYLYLPLWANFLEFFLFLGDDGVLDVCLFLNMISLFVFYFLLHRVLIRYGFSDRLAAIAVVGFMVVNVPILRTLLYTQVNLHVVNLIFASLLLYPQRPIASALAMSLAFHMKNSPLVLVLGFLLQRDFRWLAAFLVWSACLGSLTVVMHGFSPYVDFMHNIRDIYKVHGKNFRENSFDSLINALSSGLSGGVRRTAPQMVAVCKLVFGVAVLATMVRTLRSRAFSSKESRSRNLDDAIPVLMILMVMASPLVWEHHPVFLSLSYLILLRTLSSHLEWLVFGFAYFLEFLVPTFDFFPWSYGRLLSPLLWLWLAWRLAGKRAPSVAFARVNDWVANFTLPQFEHDATRSAFGVDSGGTHSDPLK